VRRTCGWQSVRGDCAVSETGIISVREGLLPESRCRSDQVGATDGFKGCSLPMEFVEWRRVRRLKTHIEAYRRSRLFVWKLHSIYQSRHLTSTIHLIIRTPCYPWSALISLLHQFIQHMYTSACLQIPSSTKTSFITTIQSISNIIPQYDADDNYSRRKSYSHSSAHGWPCPKHKGRVRTVKFRQISKTQTT